MPRRLLLLLAALTALALASLAGIASAASTGTGAQNRVGALQTSGASFVGLASFESPCLRPGSAAGSVQIVVGFCVAAEDAEDTVSLFKAPQPGRGASQFENGYSAADFPGGPGQDSDGLAYFARDKSIADEFADSYGEGVIETKVPRSVYESQYAQFEYPYQGGPRTEVPIPASAVEGLNPFERIWHP